jgi:hypothetical protein
MKTCPGAQSSSDTPGTKKKTFRGYIIIIPSRDIQDRIHEIQIAIAISFKVSPMSQESADRNRDMKIQLLFITTGRSETVS